MGRPARPRVVGRRERVPTETVQDLFSAAGLSNADFATLAGVSLKRMPTGGYWSTTVEGWLNGRRHMSDETHQLLTTRLWLRDQGYGVEELSTRPLQEILAQYLGEKKRKGR